MRLLAFAAVVLLPVAATAQQISVPAESYRLKNGLTVVIHEDHSSPVVAVNVWYHVGSGREVPGRRGFAHLFEHMMFQGSAHVGDDQHFQLVQDAGGTLNGSTNTDRTNYFETVPSNYLELALWLEADRMGWLLEALSDRTLANQRDVVRNERRQNYENRPYGLAGIRVNELLYPDTHPYHWPTIGYQEDLAAATLDEVKGFFRTWYGPNNATLVVAGDVDPARVRRLVEQYYGEIAAGPAVRKPSPRPTELGATVRETLEDRVTLARLTLSWPAVEDWHRDAAALSVLASILGGGKTGRLNERLVYREQAAQTVQVFAGQAEVAGTFSVAVTAREGTSLTQMEREVNEELARIGKEGPTAAELEQAITRTEATFVYQLASVAGKADRLNRYATLRGKPDLFNEDLARYRKVTAADVSRVARTWLVDRPRVALSVVPNGRRDLEAKPAEATP
jgi:zinc protease